MGTQRRKRCQSQHHRPHCRAHGCLHCRRDRLPSLLPLCENHAAGWLISELLLALAQLLRLRLGALRSWLPWLFFTRVPSAHLYVLLISIYYEQIVAASSRYLHWVEDPAIRTKTLQPAPRADFPLRGIGIVWTGKASRPLRLPNA